MKKFYVPSKYEYNTKIKKMQLFFLDGMYSAIISVC